MAKKIIIIKNHKLAGMHIDFSMYATMSYDLNYVRDIGCSINSFLMLEFMYA